MYDCMSRTLLADSDREAAPNKQCKHSLFPKSVRLIQSYIQSLCLFVSLSLCLYVCTASDSHDTCTVCLGQLPYRYQLVEKWTVPPRQDDAILHLPALQLILYCSMLSCIPIPLRETACGSFGASAPDRARGRAMENKLISVAVIRMIHIRPVYGSF
jgi:hypothetical protein